MTAERLLYRLLQLNAGVLLLAAPRVLLPFAWMDAVHREVLGLGSLPELPITKYMARSLSLVYAMHGVVVFFVTELGPLSCRGSVSCLAACRVRVCDAGSRLRGRLAVVVGCRRRAVAGRVRSSRAGRQPPCKSSEFKQFLKAAKIAKAATRIATWQSCPDPSRSQPL
jgi:hypothetical protein